MTAHTSVLGVDIVCHQQAIAEEVHGDGHRGGLEPDIQVRRWGVDCWRVPYCRRDLAAWARRNLFDGASPGDRR